MPRNQWHRRKAQGRRENRVTHIRRITRNVPRVARRSSSARCNLFLTGAHCCRYIDNHPPTNHPPSQIARERERGHTTFVYLSEPRAGSTRGGSDLPRRARRASSPSRLAPPVLLPLLPPPLPPPPLEIDVACLSRGGAGTKGDGRRLPSRKSGFAYARAVSQNARFL